MTVILKDGTHIIHSIDSWVGTVDGKIYIEDNDKGYYYDLDNVDEVMI